MAGRRVPWFVIGWMVLLVVLTWLALASWWRPGGAWWPRLTFGTGALVCVGNLFWAVKNRRRPRDR